jgi:hypothetical protein
MPKVPKLPGRKKKAGAKKGPAKKGPAKKGAKKVTKKKGRVMRKSRYEEEPEEFANYATMMSPAAYEAVVARPKMPSRGVSKYEYYEDDMSEEYEDDMSEEYEDDMSEEYEDDMSEEYDMHDDEGYMARHQEYTPADFTSVATPMNFSVLLMVVLFLLLILSRR